MRNCTLKLDPSWYNYFQNTRNFYRFDFQNYFFAELIFWFSWSRKSKNFPICSSGWSQLNTRCNGERSFFWNCERSWNKKMVLDLFFISPDLKADFLRGFWCLFWNTIDELEGKESSLWMDPKEKREGLHFNSNTLKRNTSILIFANRNKNCFII